MPVLRGRRPGKWVSAAIAAAAVSCAIVLPGCGKADASSTPVARPSPPHASPATASASTNQLALDLLTRLGGSGNVVFSPYSVQSALAMTDQGAAGQTEAQIEHVLHAASKAELSSDARALRSALARAVRAPRRTPAGDVARLEIANSLWTQAGLALESPFKNVLTQQFAAPPRLVDFRRAPEPARKAINSWIADRTGRIIKGLFPKGAIDRLTKLVLANAIYLKAHWLSPFDPSSTAGRPFTTASGRTVRVPFMAQQTTEVRYGSGVGYQAVDLPYLNSTLSMLLIKPTSGSETSFERRLTSSALGRLTASLSGVTVYLRMPRFHLGLKQDLKSTLSALGMPIAFTDNADFSAITTQERLAISHVEHGADLQVDEQGTVAAAATGTSISTTAAPGGPTRHMTLDHPFLALLREDRSGTILFAARVSDPSRR